MHVPFETNCSINKSGWSNFFLKNSYRLYQALKFFDKITQSIPVLRIIDKNTRQIKLLGPNLSPKLID